MDRIQLQRKAGWRLSMNAKSVARPHFWGNPFRVDKEAGDAHEVVRMFEEALLAGELDFTVEDVRDCLRGWDLACWCPLDAPCHADVLLRIANQ